MKPRECPFCNSENTAQVHDTLSIPLYPKMNDDQVEYDMQGSYTSYVICRACKARGPEITGHDTKDKKLAIEKWNKLSKIFC